MQLKINKNKICLQELVHLILRTSKFYFLDYLSYLIPSAYKFYSYGRSGE
jgi:hypothetical protein